MSIKALELEAGELLDPADDGHCFLRRCAVARHPRVHFHLDLAYLARRMRGGGHTLGTGPVADGGGCPYRHDFRVVVRIESAKQQNRVGKARFAQTSRLAHAGNSGASGACFDRRLSNSRGTHAIGLGFDHRGDAVTRLRGCLESADIVGDRVE